MGEKNSGINTITKYHWLRLQTLILSEASISFFQRSKFTYILYHYMLLFPPTRFQVSWLRGSDVQVLSTGFTKFTGDRRVKVIPAERSHTWALEIRSAGAFRTTAIGPILGDKEIFGLPLKKKTRKQRN